MSKIIEMFFGRHHSRVGYTGSCRHPQPPLGFVRRSDPNFYFLSRKY